MKVAVIKEQACAWVCLLGRQRLGGGLDQVGVGITRDRHLDLLLRYLSISLHMRTTTDVWSV